MHEVKYSSTIDEHFGGKEIMPVLIFTHGNIILTHGNIIFMHENMKFPYKKMKLSCIKFSCHDFPTHSTILSIMNANSGAGIGGRLLGSGRLSILPPF